jgi:hypothetical protein
VAISPLQLVAMVDDAQIRKGQGSRLRTVRMAAGYTSARAAALDAGWPESTYRAHEAGTRTIDPQDAARYVLWFLKHGARDSGQNFTGKWIIYGEADDLTAADFEDLLRDEPFSFKRKAYQAVLDLKKRTAPPPANPGSKAKRT